MVAFAVANLVILSFNLMTHVKSQLCDITGAGSTYSETINGATRRIIANGCPNHQNTCVGKPGTCTIRGESTNMTLSIVTPKDINIPSTPCLSNIPNGVDITCIGGSIGIMFNGVSLFSQTAGGDTCEDAISAEFTSFNICGGHATGAGQFHYHLAPACLLYQFNDHNNINVYNTHSPQIGWAMDGLPIYGPHGNNGYYIYKCSDSRADPNDCLDECNGHYANDINGHIIDGFLYHYHITGPVGDLSGNIKTDILNPAPDKTMFPYTIGCLKGIAAEWKPKLFRNAICATDATISEFVPKAMDGVAHIVYPEQVPQSSNPSPSPSNDPTNNPTHSTTSSPVYSPTASPSKNPIESPTLLPSIFPSNGPIINPSMVPSNAPTKTPVTLPSYTPSNSPLNTPNTPTTLPSNNPSFSNSPTKSPTITIRSTIVETTNALEKHSSTILEKEELDNDNLDLNSITDNASIMQYGIIAGSVTLFCICIVVVFFVCYKGKKKQEDTEELDRDEENVMTPFTPTSQRIQHAVFIANDSINVEDGENELQMTTFDLLQEATDIKTFVE